jgi:hypothetical protein
MPTSFILIVIFCNGPFEYGDGRILKLLRWMQILHHSTYDHTVLYADRFLDYKHLLVRSCLRETKNIHMESGRMLKFTFYFMERTHEPLHLVR